MSKKVSCRCQNLNLGFSLVEITLALGITSVVVISILGLLSSGLSNLHDSMNETRKSQIMRSVAGRAAVTPYSRLATNNLYFNQDGLPVRTSQDAAYIVNIFTKAPIFPGSENAVNISGAMTSLTVQIVWKPAYQSASRTNTYSLEVANDGK